MIGHFHHTVVTFGIRDWLHKTPASW